MITIVDEALEHFSAREALLDLGFGEDRHLKTCERLRAGRIPVFAYVVLDEAGKLAGTVRLWSVQDEGGQSILLLGPLAVASEFRGRGVGDRLMRHALNQASTHGHGSVVLVGDPAYYERFGFSSGKLERVILPGPFEQHRFLGVELLPGQLAELNGVLKASGDFQVNASGTADPSRGVEPSPAEQVIFHQEKCGSKA
ncbi:GNAT family N-acetyltransferase [Roseibium album]|uniref:Putative acetyltransferase n=1 Tax=Roseibium album TaxID=311410 RepID=A0A0M6Z8X2_9HYPH|nr:N-acetyltransferase [Roseibium album]CTQ59218.1 putative acetyltransferase [Roseibium album]CTQ64506.1 putative acetyltransferase [Roseibium album]CTQ74315.1 putative acetyltransferase [Roseibium album]